MEPGWSEGFSGWSSGSSLDLNNNLGQDWGMELRSGCRGEWVGDGVRAVSFRPEGLKARCELVLMLGWALE